MRFKKKKEKAELWSSGVSIAPHRALVIQATSFLYPQPHFPCVSLRCLWKSFNRFGHEKKKNTRKKKKRLVLIRCEQPELLKKTELLFLAVLRAAGSSSSPCLCFRFLSNTYRTNYAHHLLVLDRVWTLACKLEWVKVCQGQKPLEKVCGLSCRFQSGLCNMCGRHFFSRTCLKECSCIKRIYQRSSLYLSEGSINKAWNEIKPTITTHRVKFRTLARLSLLKY